jgi:outer membrane protein assembly factor BamB
VTRRTAWLNLFVFAPVQVLLLSHLHAADWPRFRGPHGNGISDEELTLLPDGPQQIWETSVGDGYSSLAIRDGRLYTVGRRPGSAGVLHCLDAATGKSIWEDVIGCWYQVSTPTVDKGRVYVLSTPGSKPVTSCYDAATGVVLWRRELPAVAQIRGYGYAGSPLLWEDLVILNIGTGLALQRNTGAVVWQHEGLAGLATPVPYLEGGQSRVLIFGGKALFARDARTGRELWSIPWQTRLAANCCDPIYHDGKVFVTTGYGKHAALFDVNTGRPRQLWKEEGSVLSSGFLWQGYLYCFIGKQFACLDFRTGKQQWTFPSGAGSVLMADEKLLLMGDTGKLTIAKLSSKSFRPVVQKQILEGITWTPAALADGKLYVRNREGKTICLRIGE